MRRAALAAVLASAALLAGCGGGNSGTTQTGTVPTVTVTAPTRTGTVPVPTATTNTPPTKHRTTPQPLGGGSSTQPLRVGTRYTCKGKPLRAISADGPVKVQPPIVRPGQSFTVSVTDPSARTATVSLAGVAPKPIQAQAKERGGLLRATLAMPRYASCGNKLLEVEGDVSAEAYVGVAG